MQSACIEWEKILSTYPNDLMALKFLHDGYIFLGEPHGIRDALARALKRWTPSTPGYNYLYGMYAFGLEESGEYQSGRLLDIY